MQAGIQDMLPKLTKILGGGEGKDSKEQQFL
jgi:hypothetical protein